MNPPREIDMTTRSSSRPSSSRRRVERTKSQRVSLRQSREKVLDTLDGSSLRLKKETNHTKTSRSCAGVRPSRSSRRTRPSRSQDDETRIPESGKHSARLGRSKTVPEGNLPERRRSFTRKSRQSSSATKNILADSLPDEQKDEERESITLSRLSKGIQRASSMHYSRRDISRRRESLQSNLDYSSSSRHNDLSGSSRHTATSGSSRRSGTIQRRRRRDAVHRRFKDQQQPMEDEDPVESMEDDSIKILQFDKDGVHYEVANNVHSTRSRSSCYVNHPTALLPEDLSEEVTEETESLDNSFSSWAEPDCAEEQPLVPTSSKTRDEDEEDQKGKETRKSSMKATQAFKAVSKLLSDHRPRHVHGQFVNLKR